LFHATAAEKSGPAQRRWKARAASRDIDLALHLPLRYEDETRLDALGRRARRRDGAGEGVGARLPRRVPRPAPAGGAPADGAGELVLRFLHFYPVAAEGLAGPRMRVRGEVRGGFFGREMVHPAVQAWSRATRRCRRR
jgi:ATP-dependent DNA helicase RecG